MFKKSKRLFGQTKLHFRMVDTIPKGRVNESSWKENFRMSFYELYRKLNPYFVKKDNTDVLTKCFSLYLYKFQQILHSEAA